METAISYAQEVLSMSGYKNADEIAQKLVLMFSSHSFVITKDLAKDIGLNVRSHEDYKDVWDLMRLWLSKYIFKEEITHCIRYALPIPEKKENKREAKNASAK